MANFREQSNQRRLEEDRKLAKVQADADAINKNAELERKEIAKTQQARKAY